jgi:outer membrane cobalamin receptor
MIPHILMLLLANQQVYEMDEIVVTAMRYPLALQNIAVATNVIDRDEIESLRALAIDEIVHVAAGVDIKNYNTPGAVTSVQLRGTPSNGTLVLMNGQPLNMATTGMADLGVIDINAVERIEIVKGPVSSVYGGNTLGGVVNIITKRNYTQPEFRIAASPFTTTFDTLLQNTYVGLVAGAPLLGLSTCISAAYQRSSGVRSNSALTKFNMHCAVTYYSDRVIANAQVLYDDRNYGVPGPVPRVDSLHPEPIFGDSTATSLVDNQDDAALLGGLSVSWNVSDHVCWEHRAFHDYHKNLFHTQYSGWTGDTIIEDHTYRTYAGGYSTMLFARLFGLDVSLGIDTRMDSLRTRTVSEQSGDTIWDASTYTFGGWCQVKQDIGDVISFVPSVRTDYHEEFGIFVSPGIGFISALQDDLILKASAGRIFRAPGLNDLYWPLSGNRDLTPEYGWMYEMRIETAPLHSIFGALSIFMRDIKDRIAWMPDTGGMWIPRNINELSITGSEIELHGAFISCFAMSIQGTYLTATQRNSEVVYDFYDWIADTGLTIIEEVERDAAFVPGFSLQSTQHIHLPYSLDIDVSERYVSETRNYYTNYDNYPVVSMDEKLIDPYVVLNASITKTIGDLAMLTIGVKNVLDAGYATQFGHSFDDLNYPAPGRTYFLTILAHH